MSGIHLALLGMSFGGGGDYIPTPASRPSIGASFEGGFYTGLIWNQVTQSTTSTAIGTGSKTFTVTDDMAATPLFYLGQAVEIRSRANPATARMKGTVTLASGTTLTVDVTSVDGSGTLTDWSVMAKYRILVAPKSSGESSSRTYKSTATSSPTAAETITEGLKATLALVADGNSTVYPAAHYCNNLTINSYSDWYLPARDELELIWRNLKPVTSNNFDGDRNEGGPDYENLGAIGDSTIESGDNRNSDPQGASYTTTVPAQTSVSAFQSGGAEAMTTGGSSATNFYWSSTQYSSGNAWAQAYHSFEYGKQEAKSKNDPFYVRAVRRSVD